jgi:VWFA-related protein
MVTLDATIEDRRTHRRIAHLTPDDFTLFEDRTSQTIAFLSEDTLPLSVVLLFDATETVRPVLKVLAEGASQLLAHLKPEDEVAVMVFSSRATLLQDFTTDRTLATAAIAKAARLPRDSDATFIHEDVYDATEQSLRSTLTDARRIQIWLTDGTANLETPQNLSQHGLHAPKYLHPSTEAIKFLTRSGAVVAPLIETSALGGFPNYAENGRTGDIERYAELTGGPVAHSEGDEIEPRLAALIDALRERYTLGYEPSKQRPPGTRCKLHLQMSPEFYAAHPGLKPRDLLIRTREEYFR